MKVLGLIVEYNPFHNGHLYHLKKSKELTNCDYTIGVMSGNFVQRGEPSLINKFDKAKIAIDNGVDLILELPTIYSTATAELFARGSVRLLDSLNIVDSISFGSESGNVNLLNKIALVLNKSPKMYNDNLKFYLKEGLSFPSARSKSLYKYFDKYSLKYNLDKSDLNDLHTTLNSSNNILGIEYLKELNKLNSKIKPYSISRIQNAYNSKEIKSTIASATAIRTSINKLLSIEKLNSEEAINLKSLIKSTLPTETYNFINNKLSSKHNFLFLNDLFNHIKIILNRFNSSDTKALKIYFDIIEGLENKIINEINHSNDIYEFLNSIKSKRYTFTKLQRILIHILINIDRAIYNYEQRDFYYRVLGFNNKGREILRKLKKTSNSKIITNIKNYNYENDYMNKILDIDIRATNIYNTLSNNTTFDYNYIPYYKKSMIK